MNDAEKLVVGAIFLGVALHVLGYNPVALLGAVLEPVVGWLWALVESLVIGFFEWLAELIADALNPL